MARESDPDLTPPLFDLTPFREPGVKTCVTSKRQNVWLSHWLSKRTVLKNVDMSRGQTHVLTDIRRSLSISCFWKHFVHPPQVVVVPWSENSTSWGALCGRLQERIKETCKTFPPNPMFDPGILLSDVLPTRPTSLLFHLYSSKTITKYIAYWYYHTPHASINVLKLYWHVKQYEYLI